MGVPRVASGDAEFGSGSGNGVFGTAGHARVLAIGGGQVGPVVAALRAAGFEVDEDYDGDVGYDGYGVVLLDPREQSALVGSVAVGRAADSLALDAALRAITVDGHPLPLTSREYELMAYLMMAPRQVFSRDELLREVWGSTWRSEGSVTEYVRRLRAQLGNHGLAGCLVTRHGFGYCYDPEAPITLD